MDIDAQLGPGGAGDPGARSTGAIRVAYLGGLGRSGSTLVSRALDRVPGLVAVGELSNLWHQSVLRDTPCGCGRAFSACPFWRAVGVSAFGGWDQVDAGEISALRRRIERVRQLPLLLSPRMPTRVAADVARYQAITVRLYEAILAVSGAQVVVDNSKLPSRAALLRGIPGLDLRVLHLVRSSYGVCYSWSKQVVRPDAPAQVMLRYPVAKSALRWVGFNASFELLRRLGVPTLSLRYEDFVTAPRVELARILSFLDRPHGAAELAFVEGTTIELAEDHSVWGNPMRMRVGREQLRLDEEWRRELGARDRRIIALLTAPGMRRYGYARR